MRSMKVSAGGVRRQAAEQRCQVVKALSDQVAHLAAAGPPQSGQHPLGGQCSRRSREAWGHAGLAAAFVALPFALHRQQLRAQQHVALRFVHAQTGPDDDVDGAGFIFQRDEDGAVGGAGLLAADDQAARNGLPAVRQTVQLGTAANAAPRQPLAQQRQRVASQGQAQGGVVVHDFFALGRGGQRQGGFVDGGVVQ